MEAKELRIGNYVIGNYEKGFECDCACEDCQCEMAQALCKVVLIDSVGYTEHSIWIESKETDVDIFEDFEGVPLTEEWLLKFGFEKKFMKNEYFDLDDWITIQKEDSIEMPCSFDFRCKKTYLTCISYVHQLQNLYFALTGEELTINTPTRE